MNKRIFDCILLPIAVVVLCACSGTPTAPDEAQPVKTAVATGCSSERTTVYPGTTRSSSELSAAFRVAGTIERVLVKQGDRVNKGQVIAELDPRDYQVQLDATEAEYAQVLAQAQRVEALYQEQATTADNYDKARFGLRQLAGKLQNHRNQLNDTKLIAPVSGYVRERLHEPGETVAAGMGVVAIAADGQGVEVEIQLPAADYRHIDQIASATAGLNGLDTPIPLSLVSVAQAANASQLYTVRFAAGSTPGLTPGISVSVTLAFNEASERDGNVSIPGTAVLNEGGTCYVFIVRNGQAMKTKVAVKALHSDGNMEVKGLCEGDTVVSAGVHHLIDGQPVKLIAEPSQDNIGGLI